ncbi:alpha-amylase family glycosyl hydrolase [Bacteroidota bacterium]
MEKRKLLLKINSLILLVLAITLISGCNSSTSNQESIVDFQQVKHVEWSKNLSIYEANVRQFTPEGTFNAFAEHLPRLKELGTDIIWLMPIHPIGEKNRKGSLGSYYAVQDYFAVNPEFGTEDDFRNLIAKVHELDMYVIIDWVANHSAWDNKMITKNPDWYRTDEKGNIVPPVPDWSDVAGFNYEVPEMQEYMIEALEFWIKEFNIDGYRCDVAGMVPVEFWNKARYALDKIKPVFMLAEANEPELHEYAFDMTYAWTMHFLWNEIAQGEKTIDDLVNQFEIENTNYNASDYRMNFTSNHDENSWKGTVYERLGDAVKTFAVFSVTRPGMPLIYSGQEACLNKKLRFFDKDTIEWNVECDLDELYSTLLKLKKENPALWNGDFGGAMERITTTADDKVFAFSRIKDENKVITILNLSTEEVEFEIADEIDGTNIKELFTDEEFSTNYKLTAWGYKVFRTE